MISSAFLHTVAELDPNLEQMLDQFGQAQAMGVRKHLSVAACYDSEEIDYPGMIVVSHQAGPAIRGKEPSSYPSWHWLLRRLDDRDYWSSAMTPVVVLVGAANDLTVPIDPVSRWISSGALAFIRVPRQTPLASAMTTLKTELTRVWNANLQRRRYRERLVMLQARMNELTPRQSSILEQLMAGKTMIVIARGLQVSKRTVELDLASIRSTFESDSTLAVVSQATEGRLLSDLQTLWPALQSTDSSLNPAFEKGGHHATTAGLN